MSISRVLRATVNTMEQVGTVASEIARIIRISHGVIGSAEKAVLGVATAVCYSLSAYSISHLSVSNGFLVGILLVIFSIGTAIVASYLAFLCLFETSIPTSSLKSPSYPSHTKIKTSIHYSNPHLLRWKQSQIDILKECKKHLESGDHQKYAYLKICFQKILCEDNNDTDFIDQYIKLCLKSIHKKWGSRFVAMFYLLQLIAANKLDSFQNQDIIKCLLQDTPTEKDQKEMSFQALLEIESMSNMYPNLIFLPDQKNALQKRKESYQNVELFRLTDLEALVTKCYHDVCQGHSSKYACIRRTYVALINHHPIREEQRFIYNQFFEICMQSIRKNWFTSFECIIVLGELCRRQLLMSEQTQQFANICIDSINPSGKKIHIAMTTLCELILEDKINPDTRKNFEDQCHLAVNKNYDCKNTARIILSALAQQHLDQNAEKKYLLTNLSTDALNLLQDFEAQNTL